MESKTQSGHLSKRDGGMGKTGKGGMPSEPNSGPVPMHHRNKLNQADGMTNPFGADAPSNKPTIHNQGKAY